MTAAAPELAVGLARSHPDAALPCPYCAAAVKGANLVRHIDKQHVDLTLPHRASWTGPERLILRPLAVIPLLFAAGVITWSWHSGRELRPWFLVAAVVMLVFIVLFAVAAADKRVFLGRLTVDGATVRLRHTLRLFTRTLGAVDRVVVGSAYRTVPDGTGSGSTTPDAGGSIEVRAGAYLRVFDGRRSITVHCRNNTGLRKTWTGWQQGKRRRRWDVTLTPADFVGFQYALAAAGLLELRVT